LLADLSLVGIARAALDLQQAVAVLVEVQLGDGNLRGVDTNWYGGTCCVVCEYRAREKPRAEEGVSGESLGGTSRSSEKPPSTYR
jgi:hypothetical protein